jgi:Peptidase C39 family
MNACLVVFVSLALSVGQATAPSLLFAVFEDIKPEGTFSGKTLQEIFEQQGVPASFEILSDWQRVDYCGLNTVFAFVNIAGQVRTLAEVRSFAGDVGAGGYNIEVMKNTARACGVPCEVIFGDVATLSRSDVPTVIHVGDGESAGHFVCLYLVSEDGENLQYGLVDGSSGGARILSQKEMQTFARECSGYMLVVKKKNGNVLRFVAFGLLANLVLWGVLVRRSWIKKSKLESR